MCTACTWNLTHVLWNTRHVYKLDLEFDTCALEGKACVKPALGVWRMCCEGDDKARSYQDAVPDVWPRLSMGLVNFLIETGPALYPLLLSQALLVGMSHGPLHNTAKSESCCS